MDQWRTIDVIGLDDLTDSIKRLVKNCPDRVGKVLRQEALKTRKEIVKNAKSSLHVDTQNKKSLGRIGSYRVSQVKGFGMNQYVEIQARSPHYHLVERGHALVKPRGRKIKMKSGNLKLLKFRNGGQTIGSVSGRFFLKKAKDNEALRFPEVIDDMVDELLKETGLW